ncbi:MAG TPA: hypothetical protein VHS78_06520 [Candidatus Elarobacter sp.]|jgi:hypothetical protein|nr:hypothetical protein [Candidatus Elarobacter sp.]
MTDIAKGLSSIVTDSVRRRVVIAVLLGALALLAFLVFSAWQLSRSNGWPEISEVMGPPVAWLLLSVAVGVFAVFTDRGEKKHAVAVATAAAGAAGTSPAPPRLVASTPWRGSVLAGLAVLAFSMSLVSSTRIGHLRTATDFELRKKEDVAWCSQRECTDAERQAGCSGSTPCTETIEACAATLSAPSSALTDELVPIDLSVYCPSAKPQQMPNATATYGPQGSSAVPAFQQAKTLRQNERVWRWFVKFARGEEPVDVRLSFVGDAVAVPLVRVQVAQPTTLAALQESTTALGGLLTALIGLFGTIGALFKGLAARSATVVSAAGEMPPG